MQESFKHFFVFVWELVESATFALTFFMVTYLFLFQVGEVHGASSYPTWKENERFITDKISYRFNFPQRGDFVVLESPQNSDIDFIKRIVGLPDEKIMLKDCQVYINRRVLEEPYLLSNICTGPEEYLSENKEIIIPSNYYFVMGDNRPNSSDSRSFGPIPKSKIVGRVIFRLWPWDRFGALR